MIITSIHAGMGNQMFMYAAGLATALRLNTELRLGVWHFNIFYDKNRLYCLDCFPEITEHPATFSDIWKIYPGLALMSAVAYKPIRKYHVFRQLIRKIFKLTNVYDGQTDFSRVRDRELYMTPKYSRLYIQSLKQYTDLKNAPDGSCLVGYWESEENFADYSDIVRKKFRFHPDCYNPVFSAQVRACNSVALHVRRTDKVRKDDSGASNLPYITRAIDKMKSLTENPAFFVFSDDIEWCKENLPKARDENYHFIEGQTPPQDMALMTICRHVIMGPSTFSWWGAYLNDNPKKIVISPDRKINMRWYPPNAILI